MKHLWPAAGVVILLWISYITASGIVDAMNHAGERQRRLAEIAPIAIFAGILWFSVFQTFRGRKK